MRSVACEYAFLGLTSNPADWRAIEVQLTEFAAGSRPFCLSPASRLPGGFKISLEDELKGTLQDTRIVRACDAAEVAGWISRVQSKAQSGRRSRASEVGVIGNVGSCAGCETPFQSVRKISHMVLPLSRGNESAKLEARCLGWRKAHIDFTAVPSGLRPAFFQQGAFFRSLFIGIFFRVKSGRARCGLHCVKPDECLRRSSRRLNISEPRLRDGRAWRPERLPRRPARPPQQWRCVLWSRAASR